MLVYKGVHICNECFSKLRNLNTLLYNFVKYLACSTTLITVCKHLNRLSYSAFYHFVYLDYFRGSFLEFPDRYNP